MTLRKTICGKKMQHKERIQYDFISIMSQSRKKNETTISFTDANIDSKSIMQSK